MSIKIKAIGFDFDGVVVDSNEIKEQAFLDIFKSEAPTHFEKLVKFHKANPTLSRSPTMRGAVREVLGIQGEAAKQKAKEWVDLYTKLTRQRVTDCPYIEGAEELLQDLKSMYPLLLASATPEGEVIKIVEGRGITPLFDEIHGAPIDKAEVMLGFMKERNIDPNEFLYIGDSGSDWLASKEAGVHFIGIDQGKSFPGFEGAIVSNHIQIRTVLKEEFGVL